MLMLHFHCLAYMHDTLLETIIGLHGAAQACTYIHATFHNHQDLVKLNVSLADQVSVATHQDNYKCNSI